MKRLFICVVGLIVTATMWSRTFDMKQLGADPPGYGILYKINKPND